MPPRPARPADEGEAAACSIIVPKEAPNEFRVFKAGPNVSTKGTFLFDADAAADVMSEFSAMGRRVSFDYDHGSTRDLPDPSKGSKSAGTCNLEVRNGELWAVDCQWTQPAADAIALGEWPYFSPTFVHDDDGRPLWVICIALTPNPALHGIPQLVAANTMGFVRRRARAELGAVNYRGYPVVGGAWDADAATHRLRRWASKDGSGDTSTIDWDKYAQGFAYVDDAQAGTFAGYKLPHHDVEHDEVVTSRVGVIAAAAALSGARGGVDIPEADVPRVREHLAKHYAQWSAAPPWARKDTSMSTKYSALGDFMKSSGTSKSDVCKAMGVTLSQLDDMAGSDESMSADHEEAFKKMKESAKAAKAASASRDADGGGAARGLVELRAVAATAGLSASTESDVLAGISDLRATGIQLLAATGMKRALEALGRVDELVALERRLLAATKEANVADAALRIEDLASKAADIRKQATEARAASVDAMLLNAQKEGRVVPAEIEGPDGLKALGIENPKRLEAMLKTRAPIQALASSFVPPKDGAGGPPPDANAAGAKFDGKKYEQLTNLERSELQQVDAKRFATLRADWNDRGSPKAPKPAT